MKRHFILTAKTSLIVKYLDENRDLELSSYQKEAPQ